MNLSLEEELVVVRQEIAEKRQELHFMESDSYGRVTDEDRFLVTATRVERQIRDLVAEEERLLAAIEKEEE